MVKLVWDELISVDSDGYLIDTTTIPPAPFLRGAQVVVPLSFSLLDTTTDILTPTSPDTVEIIGGSLPPGLFFNSNTNQIVGTISAIPKDITSYSVIMRATEESATPKFRDKTIRFKVTPADIEHVWEGDGAFGSVEIYEPNVDYNPSQPDSDAADDYRIYTFAGGVDVNQIYRGAGVNIPLPILNEDADRLSYKAVGFKGPPVVGKNIYAGLPAGLKVDQFGRIIGAPSVTNNQPGIYYFRIYVWEPQQASHSSTAGRTRRPLSGGDPLNPVTATSYRAFKLEVMEEIRLDPVLSDAVRWETPAGSLGSTYETFASHFGVKASPQFELIGNVNEIQTIRYAIAPGSLQLPTGLYLNTETGLIVGICPYVSSDRVYTFTIRAQVVFLNISTGFVTPSAVFSDRTFSFTVKSLYATDSVMSLNIAVPPLDRLTISKWIFGNQIEFNATDIEIGTSTIADGVNLRFNIPPRIAGKTNERISVLFNEVPTTLTFVRKIISGQELIEFTTAPPAGTTVVVLRYGNQPHNLSAALLTVLGNDNSFRPSDSNWGKIKNLSILLSTGLTPPARDLAKEEAIRAQYPLVDYPSLDDAAIITMVRDEMIMTALRDYHHMMKIRLGGLKTAKGYDPSGRYVYDMLYIEIYDPMVNAGGFDVFGKDEVLPKPVYQNKLNLPNRTGNVSGPNEGESTGILQWNLPQDTDRYHPASISNARKDLNNRGNRLAWEPITDPSDPNYKYNQTAAQRGLGIMGKEGLPFWMDCEQIPGNTASRLGYVPAIQLAFLKPNTGAQIVRTLRQAGFEDDLIGSEISVDRYLLISDGVFYTNFIDDQIWEPAIVDAYPANASNPSNPSDWNNITAPFILDDVVDSLCTFDGPDNPISPTSEFTTFDLALMPISKYYKFPPGDKTAT